MLSRKSVFLASVLTCLFVTDVISAAAQEWHTCFTLRSVKGSYSVVGTYGANVAIALAKRYVDGDGNLTGKFLVNETTSGSITGGRTLVAGTQAGTISVNCDGTGVVTRVLTVAGVQTNQFDDFVITEAKMKDGELIAKTIVDAQRSSSAIVPGGVFLRRTWTRVP
jgi:hypothetical protein